jgi:hypothetical protein
MKKPAILFLFCILYQAYTHAQQTDSDHLQAAIDSETFIFEARQASGIRGRMIQVDPGYTLAVSPAKVKGDLPFFGRSYQAAIGSSEGGLKFEFSEFDFLVKPRKKGGYEVTIGPNGPSDVRSIYLTIQKNGSASLRVISNTKESMSYTGNIRE